MLISFIVLGSVAEEYLTPVLTRLSEAFNLSETIAGVTLLAFANGAPDILSVISAGGEESGIYIAVGNLFGACLFASTLVIGRCISTCPHPIHINPASWNRDLIFYIFALSMVLFFGWIGNLQIWMSLSFFGVYLVYFVIVLTQDMLEKKDNEVTEENKERGRDSVVKLLGGSIKRATSLSNADVYTSFVTDFDNPNPLAQGERHSVIIVDDNLPEVPKERSATFTLAEFKSVYVSEAVKVDGESDKPKSVMARICQYIKMPMDTIIMVIVPNVDEEKIERWWTPILPLTSVLASITLTSSSFGV